MAIVTDLLIAAPMLQDYLVDKDTGFPLSGGIISLYKDTDRQIYKNWYYQTGVPTAYEWVTLDNPLTLSSVGTIQDPLGNDVIPFYYPYDETSPNPANPLSQAYYITVVSSDSIPQFTRENFPFVAPASATGTNNPTLRNYIVNNVFWRNLGASNLTEVTNAIVAPSQHDGFTFGDIRFIKNIAGANEVISFLPITESALSPYITPEYALNIECNSVQVGESEKCIMYPISLHLKTLQDVSASVVISAQNVAGASNNFINIQLYQFTGSGAVTAPVVTPWGPNNGKITLTNNWETYIISDIVPSAQGLDLGPVGDDALFLRISYPLSAEFNISHTKVRFYLSSIIPENDFDTYDEIAAIINSPRTGEKKYMVRGFYPFGWIPLNNGTIGNATSNATCRANADTYLLYEIIWLTMKGASEIYAPMYTSAGIAIAYGTSAIEDFIDSHAISLFKTVGQTSAGTIFSSDNDTIQVFTTNYPTDIANLQLTGAGATTTYYGTGSPVVMTSTGTLPTGLVGGKLYYSVYYVDNTNLKLAPTIEDALAHTNIVEFSSNGTGVHSISLYLQTDGKFLGEETHAITEAELAPHTHTYNKNSDLFNTSGSGNPGFMVNPSSQPTGSTGSGTPHNTMQPTTYWAEVIKL